MPTFTLHPNLDLLIVTGPCLRKLSITQILTGGLFQPFHHPTPPFDLFTPPLCTRQKNGSQAKKSSQDNINTNSSLSSSLVRSPSALRAL